MSDISFAAGTVITSDYLPWARVLAASFAQHHPGVRFVVAVLDEPDPALLRAADRFEVVRPAQMGLDEAELGWMSAIYNGFELSCAVKPWLLRFLLRDAEAALYLDSDILVTESLHDIAARCLDADVVLTPHTLAPPPADRREPSEDNFLRLGQFNAGFLAVGRTGIPFLDWWGARLRREGCDWSEHEPRRFVDQRWLDLVVNYFRVHILRETGANVAYWNVAARQLEHGPDGYTADGSPLLFLHFSGFEPSHPEVFSKHALPGTAPSTPALLELSYRYAALLADAGLDSSAGRPAPLLPGGLPRSDPYRAALRHALLAAERCGVITLPDPADVDAVLTWLRSPVTAAGTSWYLWGLRASHTGVRGAFAQVPGPDEARYLAWAAQDGVALGLVPLALAHGTGPVVLNDARGFVVLVSAEEVLSDPTLLAGIAERFDATDDVSIVVHAPGYDADTFTAALDPVLGALGLDGPTAPDLLGLLTPAAPAALVPVINAVLTRHPVDPTLANLPHASDAAALRALADGFAARRVPTVATAH